MKYEYFCFEMFQKDNYKVNAFSSLNIFGEGGRKTSTALGNTKYIKSKFCRFSRILTQISPVYEGGEGP